MFCTSPHCMQHQHAAVSAPGGALIRTPPCDMQHFIHRHCCSRWDFRWQVLMLYETPQPLPPSLWFRWGCLCSSPYPMCATADMLPSFCLVRALFSCDVPKLLYHTTWLLCLSLVGRIRLTPVSCFVFPRGKKWLPWTGWTREVRR